MKRVIYFTNILNVVFENLNTVIVLFYQKDKGDPLSKVMNEFENVVQKYVAIAKTIQAQRKAKQGEMTDAVSMWKEASDMGYSRSQFNLGLSYETGQGVKKDARKVFTLDSSFLGCFLFQFIIIMYFLQ